MERGRGRGREGGRERGGGGREEGERGEGGSREEGVEERQERREEVGWREGEGRIALCISPHSV